MSVSSAYCTHTTELTLCLPASAIGGTLTLDENDNPPNLKQVKEKEKKTRRFVSLAKYNARRSKEIERMKLLEEVKKRLGSAESSKQ